MFKSRYLVAVLAAVTLAACRDSTAPPPNVDLALALASTQGPTISTDAFGNPTISCRVQLTAAASGRGSASWLGATIRIFTGKERKDPVESRTIEASTVAASWNAAAIAAGETQHSTWNVSRSIPFAGELEFRYGVDGGDVKRAKVSFTCGPTIAPDAGPPIVTFVNILPSSGAIRLGTRLDVSYQVSAPAGVWQTYFRITGPCFLEERFTEQLQPVITHEVLGVSLPTDCALGVPLALSVFAVDAAGQTGSRTLTTSLVIVGP
jgi:hypothetical protein